MPGGLINIVTYGSQDLFLTGTPHITFFKVVYRRHTNFSMESIKMGFDDSVGFGKYSTKVIPKNGDLIHKCYLEIKLPEIAFKRNNNTPQRQAIILNASQNVEDAKIDLFEVLNFTEINLNAYARAIGDFEAVNTVTKDIAGTIISYFNSINQTIAYTDVITNFQILLQSYPQFSYNTISLDSLAKSYSNIIEILPKEDFLILMNKYVSNNNIIVEFFRKRLRDFEDILNDELNTNLKFAWVKKLGHSIIDYIQIHIGGEEIDKQYGDWMNIWAELTIKDYHQKNYDSMIGNVSTLTSFNRNTKPSYVLMIPLQFWFNKFNGLALPILALQYSEVTLSIKLRNMQDLAYIEDLGTKVNLDDMAENSNYNLSMNLCLDYIYLDTLERRKFAQAGHEYLIEQIQYLEMEGVVQDQVSIRLDLNNPTREVIWVVQKNSFITNLDGHTECLWYNYSINRNNIGNPIRTAEISLNGFTRVQKEDGAYFNYVQPYYSHTKTPSDGINLYSFALKPEEHQPSGSCNFTRIPSSVLQLDIDKRVFENNDTINIRVYAPNFNILRIIGGMGALAYAYA